LVKEWKMNGEGILCYFDGKIDKGIFENDILIK
jgi:hypothetical protein